MLTKDKVIELANKALLNGNPYINKSILFYIDHVEHYLFANEVMNLEQINYEYHKTAQKDIKVGYNDRMAGYYDKWCRYNRFDGGRAYDLGVQFALTEKKCKKEMYIIECQN